MIRFHSTIAIVVSLILVSGCQSSGQRGVTWRGSASRAGEHSPKLAGSTTSQEGSFATQTDSDEPQLLLASGEESAEVALPPEPDSETPVLAESASIQSGLVDTGLSLPYLEQLAIENNPAIRQASASAHKGMGLRDQVGRRPNPTLEYNGEQLGDAGTDQHMLTISQDFVTANKLGLNQQVLDQAVQAQLWEVEAQRRRVLTDVRVSFYDALAAQRRYALASDFQTVAVKGVKVAVSRKAALEGSQPEILQAEIQQQEVELQQQQAEYELQAAWKELTATIGLPDLPMSDLIGDLPVEANQRDWETVYLELTAASPEIRAASSRISKAQANLNRQGVQRIPNVNLSVGVGTDLGTGSEFGRVGVGIPLPLHNKNEGNIAAAQAEYCRACQDLERLRMSLKARLARAAKDHDSALAAVRRYESQILPKAKESLTLSEQAYAAGEFTFLQVLTARRTYFDSNLQAVEAKRRLAQATAHVDGLLLSGGLSETVDLIDDDGLRGQALSGQ
jgi:cobalt-zinc-cadmium efflux system outer membrane protein